MAEVLTNGYEALRAGIDPNATNQSFDVIELTNSGTGVVRLSTSDSRVTVNSAAEANPYEIEVTVTGADSEITQPQTIDGSRVYEADAAGEEVTPIETFSSVTLDNDQDELTVRHQIEIPQI